MGGSEPEPLLWPLVLQFILILINAVFSCTEIAVISMNGAKLELMSDAGNKRAKRLLSVSRLPSKFLAIMEVGMILAGFLGSAFAANNFSDRLMRLLTGIGMKLPEPVMNKISIVVITLILSYFTLVLGELVPKRIGMRNAEKIGLVMSGFVFVFAKIFTPAVWLLTVSTNGMLRLFRIDPNAEDEKVTEEEIRIMVDTGSDEGAIDVEEKEFIHNVFELDDITVDKIMTHRTEVTMLWLEESDEVWEETIIGSRHSIYPICEDDQDNIIGILNTKDYFRQKDRSRENIMKTAVKSPQFVPETALSNLLLRNMKKNRNHFAVILDEYGGMSGIVTMTDLLEQLVGDLEDDTNAPAEEPLVEPIDSETWSVNGAATLEMVEKAVGVELPCDEYDTFAGMVLGLLGSVPEDGSTAELEEYGLKIKIVTIKEHRLEKAVVCKAEG